MLTNPTNRKYKYKKNSKENRHSYFEITRKNGTFAASKFFFYLFYKKNKL